MSKVSKTSWAYAAGILDGEGSISISATNLLTSAGNVYKGYDLKVMISNTDVGLMNWFKANFGGVWYAGGQNSKVAQTKPCYRWILTDYAAMELFILAVLPYMLIKREQAKLALEYIRLKGAKNPPKREELHQRCKALNSGDPQRLIRQTFETELKIESELTGDRESELAVTQVS